MAVTIFSPAKINLFLAVNHRRADGFHDLVSVAAPLDFGDHLEAQIADSDGHAADLERRFTLECDESEVPVDASNLILKATKVFAQLSGWSQSVHFRLTKRIPIGAGLGGGSSNAVAALRALNVLSGGLLSAAQLQTAAVTIGSDCALFLSNAPIIMRGRGEQVTKLPVLAVNRLRGRRVLLFKPSFGISTPWAYQRMAAEAPGHYFPVADAEQRLADWIQGDQPAEALLFNNMERVAFQKFIALPVLLAKLQHEVSINARMSGSGSACFALLPDAETAEVEKSVTQMKQIIAASWGGSAFVREARLT